MWTFYGGRTSVHWWLSQYTWYLKNWLWWKRSSKGQICGCIDISKENSNVVGLGYDEGTVVIKIGSDEPVVSMKYLSNLD